MLVVKIRQMTVSVKITYDIELLHVVSKTEIQQEAQQSSETSAVGLCISL